LNQQGALGDGERRLTADAGETRLELFERHFDAWVALARARAEGSWSFRAADEARRFAALREAPIDDVSKYMKLEHPEGAQGPARELCERRKQVFDELWSTPFYAWVRRAYPGDFKRMTRCFLLQWVVDNWTCADYFAFDTTYAEPKTPLERGINRLSTLYASEMNRRYLEWESLSLDDYTGFTSTRARHTGKRVEAGTPTSGSSFRFVAVAWIAECFVASATLMRSLGEAMRTAPGATRLHRLPRARRIHCCAPSRGRE
jgi:hypothetical protein